MNFGQKPSSLQAFHMVLYRKGLHPEFFGIEDRTALTHGDFDFEAWVFKGGHVLQFQTEGLCLTELVTEHLDGLPHFDEATCMPCAGERDHKDSHSERIDYVTSITTETLSDNLYVSTFDETVKQARDNRALMCAWADQEGRDNLSVIELQRLRDDVHVQCYHLRSDCALVLRTVSLFTLLAGRQVVGGAKNA